MHPFYRNTIRRHMADAMAPLRNRLRVDGDDLTNEPGRVTWFMAGLVAGLMLGHWLFS